MNKPKYSLIVPTYNRVEELRELIPSIQDMNDVESLELVIIDDGSTDNTEEYLMTLNTSFPIQYKKQQNKGPGMARNHGMSVAQGNYFLFVDSDCILPKDYLEKIDSALVQTSLDAFGGPDTFHPSFSPLLKAIDYSMTSFIGTGGTRGSEKSVTKYFPRSFNMGFHRKVYDTIGGFSDIRHGQDMDYSARIYNAGFSVGLIPEAYVYHKRRTSIWRFFKQIHNWGVTRINLASMHDGMLKPIHLAPAVLTAGFPIALILIVVLQLPVLGLLMAGCMIAIALLAFFQSLTKYKSLKVALLSIITLYIQVFAYGLGSLNGMWQKWVLKKEVAIGITKNYYK